MNNNFKGLTCHAFNNFNAPLHIHVDERAVKALVDSILDRISREPGRADEILDRIEKKIKPEM
ncbi:MAG: hypothetical protein V2I97_16005 [Desulfococcaceae bacterium]|nr:hypothetical protein [Desulfococcaceae bacterium]